MFGSSIDSHLTQCKVNVLTKVYEALPDWPSHSSSLGRCPLSTYYLPNLIFYPASLNSFFLTPMTSLFFLKHAKYPGPLHLLANLTIWDALSSDIHMAGSFMSLKPLLKIPFDQQGVLNHSIYSTWLNSISFLVLYSFITLIINSISSPSQEGRGGTKSSKLHNLVFMVTNST